MLGAIQPLTVRITTTTVGKAPIVAVEGRLTATEVPSLREACRSVGTGLRLDLSGLRMADEAGIGELRLLSEEGAELHGASLLIRQLLDGKKRTLEEGTLKRR
jgi:anti-anti-sigma regulatory factor